MTDEKARTKNAKSIRVIFDIGHPGHFHLFKNTAKQIKENGGDVAVILRDKDNAGDLASSLAIPMFSVEGHKKGLVRKALHSFSSLARFFMILKDYNPDVVVGEGSFYMSQPAFLQNKPAVMVCMNDHAWLENALFYPFTRTILTSHSFTKDFGKRQKRFNGYLQQFYLSPEVFKPSKDIHKKLGLEEGEEYAIIRCVAWTAHHDIGMEGFSLEMLRKATEIISKKMRVFISSETMLPEDLIQHTFPASPDDFQDALAFASLSLGDGATVAAESAILGIPTIHFSPLVPGYIADMEKRGLLSRCLNLEEMEATIYGLTKPGSKEKAKAHRDAVLPTDDLHTLLYRTLLETAKPKA